VYIAVEIRRMRVGIVAKPSNKTVIIVVRILNRTLEYSQCYISEVTNTRGVKWKRKRRREKEARTRASLKVLKRIATS